MNLMNTRRILSPALASVALLLAAAPQWALAERQPNRNGSCPSGYTKSADSHGKAQCYSPSDVAHKSKQQASKSKKKK
jgi:hypothetical protein